MPTMRGEFLTTLSASQAAIRTGLWIGALAAQDGPLEVGLNLPAADVYRLPIGQPAPQKRDYL